MKIASGSFVLGIILFLSGCIANQKSINDNKIENDIADNSTIVNKINLPKENDPEVECGFVGYKIIIKNNNIIYIPEYIDCNISNNELDDNSIDPSPKDFNEFIKKETHQKKE